MRFFFLKKTYSKPSGGHKHIRLLISQLNKSGVEASLLYIDGRRQLDWSFDLEVPIASFTIDKAHEHIKPDDVVVFPENTMKIYLSLISGWRCRKAMLNQNGYYALRSSPWRALMGLDIDFAIATSSLLAAITHSVFRMPTSRICMIPGLVEREGADDATANERLPYSVCFMPRKLPGHIRQIQALVSRRIPHVRWLPIENISDMDVTATFRRSWVFLSTQNEEGLGLPAIEAMNCGCIAAGYAGTDHFPHPYALPSNGVWAPDRSIGRAANALCHAIGLVEGGGSDLKRMREAGRAAAQRYSRREFDEAVLSLARSASKGSPVFVPPGFAPLGWGGWWEVFKILVGRLWKSVAR